MLILPAGDYMKSEEKLLLFGTENLENDPRVEVLYDRDLAFEKVCENDKYLTFGMLDDHADVNMYPCPLRIYDLNADHKRHGTAFHYVQSSGTLYFSKETPNRVIEKNG